MFYEAKNLLKANDIKIEHGKDLSFPMHLHGSFELIAVTEGEMKVTVDKKDYLLTCGQALLVFPNQAHKLITENHSCHYLCIFSPELVRAYSKICLSKVPESNLFSIDRFYIDKLQALRENSNIAQIKGLLYALCGEFDAGAAYRDRNTERDGLLFEIFKFVENNYDSDCDLEALSKAITYDYVYLSRYFKERTGISFTEYVNRYRVTEACYLILNTQKTFSTISGECGFASLRSFNRNFVKIMGFPPCVYRAEIGKSQNQKKDV